jgi:hypothetical protein
VTDRENPKTGLQSFRVLFTVCRELATRLNRKRRKPLVERPTTNRDVEVGTSSAFTLAQARRGVA